MSLLKAATLMIIHTLMIMWYLIRGLSLGFIKNRNNISWNKKWSLFQSHSENYQELGCFQTVPEPTSQQLSNKIANMKKVKKVLNLSETVENTYNLREKIKEFLEVPDNVNEGYVPYANILDEKMMNLGLLLFLPRIFLS